VWPNSTRTDSRARIAFSFGFAVGSYRNLCPPSRAPAPACVCARVFVRARACLCVLVQPCVCACARACAHSSMVRYGWLRGTAAVDRLESPPTLSNASRSSADHSSIASTRMSSDFARECVQPTTPSTLRSTKSQGNGEACSGSSVRCVTASVVHSISALSTNGAAHRYGYSWCAAMIIIRCATTQCDGCVN
jgi:hypothetical protein